MFSTTLRHIFPVCSRVFVRNIRRGRLGTDIPKGPNPGLDNRMRVFKNERVNIEDGVDTEEFLEESESDFYKAGQALSTHAKEMDKERHALRHQLITEKYFKEHMPNLLTWSEKEQIRHLCNEHPEEWTPETIAESFPVTASVVVKLLKYAWKPVSLERIKRHDASALRNWRELKEGTLQIPEDLRQHFLKFSDRTIPPLNVKSLKQDLTPARDMGEFERIVERCAPAEDKDPNLNTKYIEGEISDDDKDSKANVRKKDLKVTTLDELTSKIRKRLDSGKEVNLNDKLMIDSDSKEAEVNINNYDTEITLEEQKPASVTLYNEEEKTVAVKKYPERIRIPKKAFKKGATYKVDDCYYDYDGTFLYRVIGMTNSSSSCQS